MKETDKNNFDSRPIGFFDSGVGGLTVLDKVKAILPNEKFIYYGDTKHMPYGEKTEQELLIYADEIFKFFEKQNAKAVVMACNTTSAVTYEKLKNNYSFKIYPIIQTVAKVLANMDLNCIGIFATPATINSHCYSKQILSQNSDIQVVEIACKNWVKFVENSKLDTDECKIAVKEKLDEMMNFNPDKIVLGCTHYPYLMDLLTEFLDYNKFIDPSIYFAKAIKEDLIKNSTLTNDHTTKNCEFFVSSNPEGFRKAGSMFYNFTDEIIKCQTL